MAIVGVTIMYNKLSKIFRQTIQNKDTELFFWYENNSDEIVAQMAMEKLSGEV